ncbi:nuclear transport factor 2 family protein [Rhizobium leguminosarum]|nr:nuclear transport factor 2 family protein [Rhizobium leguminosarum]MBY5837961.1 nuclear transport factor 2 family protein [Rhizobium leguminosarum]NKK99769.1 nuclear transport factor 2 family protein [Rhizobium leguminosarum bv. viciae]NKL81207.1 nuclear transport factor 2 family protein [Rhizobium leguminosarum bv. viciae]NKM77259.1 nuclear transport factor 2 family protein [Rhizobium leguminosarum bv. viciae]
MRKPIQAIARGVAAAVLSSVLLAQFDVAAAADEAANKATVQKAFDAWSSGTGSPYDLLADNVEWTITGNSAASKAYGSRDAFISEVIKPFNARMSVGLKPTIRNMYADGDTVIVFFDAAGTAKDGKPYMNTYAWFLDMQDGKIVNASAFFDSIAFNELWKLVPAE